MEKAQDQRNPKGLKMKKLIDVQYSNSSQDSDKDHHLEKTKKRSGETATEILKFEAVVTELFMISCMRYFPSNEVTQILYDQYQGMFSGRKRWQIYLTLHYLRTPD